MSDSQAAAEVIMGTVDDGPSLLEMQTSERTGAEVAFTIRVAETGKTSIHKGKIKTCGTGSHPGLYYVVALVGEGELVIPDYKLDGGIDGNSMLTTFKD